eukprot:1336154-Alexandrium_andersonii.AAC.1
MFSLKVDQGCGGSDLRRSEASRHETAGMGTRRGASWWSLPPNRMASVRKHQMGADNDATALHTA